MINLLPEKYKEILLQGVKQVSILKWQIFLIFILTISLAGMGLLYYSVTVELDLDQTILSVINSETTAVRKLQENIKSLNAEALKVQNILESRECQEEIIKKVASIVPDDITLSSLSINKQENGYIVTLRGLANDSDALYIFKDNLETGKDFDETEFPLADLIKEKDIDFSVSFIYQTQHEQ